MKKILFGLIAMICIFFVIEYDVDGAYDLSGGGQGTGQNSVCNGMVNGYIACYNAKFQFRVTLVDEKGNKVDGTHSVDFTQDNSEYIQVGSNPPYSSINDGGKRYEHAYTNGKDYTYPSDYKYIGARLVSPSFYQKEFPYGANPDKYETFANEFNARVKNQALTDFKVSNGDEVNFISMFLYYSGFGNIYAENSQYGLGSKQTIDINSNTKLKEASKNYYLLIEPTYNIYFTNPEKTGTGHWYGTSHEIVNFMYVYVGGNLSKYTEDGFFVGLSANFIAQAGCNLYMPLEKAKQYGFEGIKNNPQCDGGIFDGIKALNNIANINIARETRRNVWWDAVRNPSNGYGQSVIKISNIIIPPPSPEEKNENININYTAELCSNNRVSITAEEDFVHSKQLDNNIYMRNDYKIGAGTGDSSLYCYDQITIDYKDLSDVLEVNRNLRSGDLIIQLPKINISVDRNCYVGNNADKVNEADIRSTSKYDNLIITLHAFEYSYRFKQTNSYIENQEKKADGWKSIKINYEYSYNDSIFLIKNQQLTGIDYYIEFPSLLSLSSDKNKTIINDIIFNESKMNIDALDSKVKNYLYKDYDLSFISDSKKYNLKYGMTINNYTKNNNIKDNIQCNLNVNVDTNGDGYQFRIIDLNNPFPARDGTSRLPGSNWINKYNYIYQYITNNRGVQYLYERKDANADLIYSSDKIEPMYVITLDASTMMKIREYNKNNDYNSINEKLKCDDNNRQCVSEFLRNNHYIKSSNFKGACSDSSKFNTITSIKPNDYNEEYFRDLLVQKKYEKKYDLNMNYKIDVEDSEIYTNYDKNTFYYTCANKTYKSGG